MNHKKLLNLYGLKWNPFDPSIPLEALVTSPQIESFCFRMENLVLDGGFGMITENPGCRKSVALRILSARLEKLRIPVQLASDSAANWPLNPLVTGHLKCNIIFNAIIKPNCFYQTNSGGIMSFKERYCMNLVREVLRLKLDKKLSNRQIGSSVGISKSTVATYLERAISAGLLSLKNIQELSDEELKEKIFPFINLEENNFNIDFNYIRNELKRPHVTLKLIWKEEKEKNKVLCNYSHYCDLYKNWKNNQKISMKQTYKAGEKMFIDYAGTTMPITNSKTGEIRNVQIFLGVLGQSNYTYIEATESQNSKDFISSHINAFKFFGGCPEILVPDNLKSGVTATCKYEPSINKSYRAMADHYGSRKSNFENFEKNALMELPSAHYEVAEWKNVKSNIDYHIEFDHCYYSVHYKYRNKKLTARCTDSSIEIFLNHQRIAVHKRITKKGSRSTTPEHMPKTHREYADWSPSRIINWAEKIGPHVKDAIELLLSREKHPELSFRSCLGIIRLEKYYTKERVDNACKRAIEIKGISFKSIKSILEKGLDSQKVSREEDTQIQHENIRGADYFH